MSWATWQFEICGLRLLLSWSEHQLLFSITYSNQATTDEVKVLFEHFFWQQITWAGQMGAEQINWGKCNGGVDDCQQSQKLGKLLSCKMPTMSLFNLFLDIIWTSCPLWPSTSITTLSSEHHCHLLSLLCYHYVPPWLSLGRQELKKSHAAVKTKWP